MVCNSSESHISSGDPRSVDTGDAVDCFSDAQAPLLDTPVTVIIPDGSSFTTSAKECMEGANNCPDNSILIVNPNIPVGKFNFVAADSDGTGSILREGWPPIMEECIVSWVTGGNLALDTDGHIRVAAKEMIDRTTGITTIFQMEEARGMVERFKLVAPGEILTPEQYKADYLGALMENVAKRRDALATGEANPWDFMVKGSFHFFRELRARVEKMIIFSGTDQADVEAEVALLGLDQHFDEIYGAVGRRDKKDVLQELLDTEPVEEGCGLVIGDGPVELEVGKAHGFAAVGICSDEAVGQGWNWEKLPRLLKAEADIIIADFRRADELLGLLFNKR